MLPGQEKESDSELWFGALVDGLDNQKKMLVKICLLLVLAVAKKKLHIKKASNTEKCSNCRFNCLDFLPCSSCSYSLDVLIAFQ